MFYAVKRNVKILIEQPQSSVPYLDLRGVDMIIVFLQVLVCISGPRWPKLSNDFVLPLPSLFSPGHVDVGTNEEISPMGRVQVPLGKPSWWNLISFSKPHPIYSFKGIPMSSLYHILWRSVEYLVIPLDSLLSGGGYLSTWGTMVPQR